MATRDEIPDIQNIDSKNIHCIPIEYREILNKCNTIINKKLKSLLRETLDSTDDTLFEMADKAKTDAVQTFYFDSMRMIRVKREEAEKNYNGKVDTIFNVIWETPICKENNTSIHDADLLQVGLVNETELEESIATKNIISKIHNRYEQDIYAIEQRMSYMLGDYQVNENTNPVGPTRICEILQEAIEILDADVEIKLIIYKLFDKYISRDISEIYSILNKYFSDKEILPGLKYRVNQSDIKDQLDSRNHHIDSQEEVSFGVRDSEKNIVNDVYLGQDKNNSLDEFSALQTLLEIHRKRTTYTDGNSNSEEPTPMLNKASEEIISPEALEASRVNGTQADVVDGIGHAEGYATSIDVLNALSSIQLEELSSISSAEGKVSASEVRSLLLNEFKTIQDSKETDKISPIDNDTIDIVSMMFDYILGDVNIPNAVNILISRLQIPMLKVAILDKEFFGKKMHPARKLLNGLARMGISLNEQECNKSNYVFKEIEYIVNRIIDEFVDDLDIFEELMYDIVDFLSSERLHEDKAKASTAEKCKERELIELTKAWVTQIINERIEGAVLNHTLKDFMYGAWRDVLLNTYLEHGGDSRLWKEQIRFIDILLWSMRPKKTAIARKRMAGIIQSFLDTLRSSLKAIAYPVQDIEHIITILEPLHLLSFRGLESNDNYLKEGNEISNEIDELIVNHYDQRLMDDMEEKHIPLYDQLDDRTLPKSHKDFIVDKNLFRNLNGDDKILEVDDEYLRLARALELGKWIEFTDKNNEKKRAKLAWKSELLGECTFLDWKHQAFSDISVEGLAISLQRGSAKLIDDVPIFDRALDAVTHDLERQASQ